MTSELLCRTPWETRPAWACLRSRDQFGGDGQLLSLSAKYGVRERVEGEGRAASTDTSNYRRVETGDLVINRLVAKDGAIAVSTQDGLVSPAYWVLVPPGDLDSRFVNYVLTSSHYLAEIGRRSKFMPPAQFDLPWEQFRTMPIPHPATSDQRAIADYLDREIARIDGLISKKRRMIDLLEERVDSQVLRLVEGSPLAGGTTYEATPIRRVLARHERWISEPGEMITAFRDGEVTSRAARGREGFTNAWKEEVRVQTVNIGDVVVHGLDGFSGAIGDAQVAGVCSPVYHVCSVVDDHGDSAFYGRLLRLLALNGYLGNFAISTRERAVDFRNWDLFGRIPIPLAPSVDQNRIGKAIRAIRPLRELVLTFERLAVERRQVLITAAVTGELEVVA